MTLRSRYAQQAYRSDDVLTLSPVGLVVRVQRKAVQSLVEAARLMDSGERNAARTEINRARGLIAELRGALDHEAGGHIATELDRIYEYLIARFLQAGSNPHPQVLVSAAKIVDKLRQGFDIVLEREQTGSA